MFHNKAIANKKLNKRITFLTTNDNYVNRIYNLIISNISRHKQYDKYYVVNSDMLFFDPQMNVVINTPYLKIMKEIVEDTISNQTVMSEIISGKALLIFDFGSEIAPLSTDDTTIYGIINQHFKDLDCIENVVYWTMYESPFDIVDESECAVNIVSASLSTLRYISFKYNLWEHLSHNNLVEPKSAMYLNRRIRSHRSKLLVECLRREVDLDDIHFSYMGSDEIISMGNEDVSHNIDLVDLLTTKVDKHQISKSNFKKVVTELYGKQIAMEDKDIVKWLGSSKIGRVIELFNHRAKSKFEIITEYTSTEDNIQISEKLSLAMLSKMPFVVLGDKGYMNHLKELGFKTFDKIWSEDYDKCEADERVKSLTSTILDIQKNFNCELDEYDNWIYNDEMLEILEHNYIHYKDVYSQTLCDRIVKSVSKPGAIDDYSLDLINKIWYNEINDSVFVPISGNEYRYFETMIASDLQYKLMNRKDVPNLETLTAYVAIRSPYERMKHEMFRTSLTISGIIERYKDSDYMKSQSSFTKGLNIKGVVDLSEIHNQVIIFGQHDKTYSATRGKLLIPQPLVNMINYFYAMPGIESDMEENLQLTDKEKEVVCDLFKEDFEFYNRYGYRRDI
jgi:hypothetical protein